MEDLKNKVLLITETPPGTPNGFGVTLKCLFKETPHHVLYTDIAYREHGEKHKFTLAQVPYHRSKRYLVSFLSGRIPEWRNHYSKSWLHKNLKENYSVVYAFVYSTNCLLYASWISDNKKLPLIIHLADHSKGLETPPISKIIKGCYKLVCITEEMKVKFEKMLGRKDIKVLHNGAESKCYNLLAPSNALFNEKNPFIICFLGGLFSHLHSDCIEDVFEAVSKLRKQCPRLEFHLYGQINPKTFLFKQINGSGITHHGIVMPLDKKYEIMEQTQCFIIPSSFNQQYHEHYRYSFPTKLPELIASGRPILSYGPPDTATNRLLNANNLGIRLQQRSVDELIKVLSEIMDNYSGIVDKVVSQNSRIAKSFSATTIRKGLAEILTLN